MKTKFYAVLHVTARQFTKLANLGNRVILKLTENVADFPAPAPTVGDLTTETNKLVSLNAQAKGNTQKKDERDQQALLVYDMLSDSRNYVNGIAKGNKVLVDKSGFDADKEPETQGIPPVPAIRKMVDGAAPNTAKILLMRPLTKGARYSVQIVTEVVPPPVPPLPDAPADDPFDPNNLPWEEVLDSVNSNELVLTGLKRGKDMAVRVRAEHGSKKSDWSDLFLFMPR